MPPETSLGRQIVARELRIQNLLSQSTLIGGIYTMGYEDCLVLTNDLWKKQAGGVPQHCFLLATAFTPGDAPEMEDEEVVLLRVVGPADLPAERELVQVRAEAMREMVVSRGVQAAATAPAILDVLTRNEIQFSGIRAKILGTFYDIDVNGRPLLSFGSDVETFYSASRYKVYKPFGESLAAIASHPEVTEDEMRHAHARAPQRVRIGTVRYSSSTRRRRANAGRAQDIVVPVKVKVEDFISMKTAVFGMTRLGKSNMMKIIATAVFQHAREANDPIGQLLFDPAGEYANVNVQDQTALAQLGEEHVVRYRLGGDGTDGFRALATNYFSDETIGVTWSIIQSQLAEHASSAQYVRDFLTADIIGPDDAQTPEEQSSQRRARRRRMAFYATLIEAGFQVPAGRTFALEANAAVRTAVSARLTQKGVQDINPTRGTRLSSRQLVDWFKALCEIRMDPNFVTASRSQTTNEPWVDPALEHILRVFDGNTGAGARVLNAARQFHNVTRESDYAQEIYDELGRGRIVIIDLSRGSEAVQQFCSEQIVQYILGRASGRFIAGQEPVKMQIFVEEAHRLFNRDKMKDIESVDPYVRLAKEAAKYRIGLIYATQEVSSVDPLILSNTSNWIVTHLNNQAEVKELSKYYDFQDFGELTLKAEDVGFARIKTRSSRYIVPVQIDLFDAERIRVAREARPAAPAHRA